MRAAAAAALLPACAALHVAEKSVDGTAPEADGLSQKQLAILRYFAQLTFMSDGDADPWAAWRTNGTLPGGVGSGGQQIKYVQQAIESIRYQLSNDAYAVALSALRTPAYTEVHSKILRSASHRMTRPEVWPYVPGLYPNESTNGGSDPVRYKNIMYSAHLAKTMALSELISGEPMDAWEFAFEDKRSPYNISRLMRAMYDQMSPPGGAPPEWGPSYAGGGVPCEPPVIFLICNNFPHNAFHIYDGVHGTRLQDSDARWQDTVRAHGVNRVRARSGNYFRILYDVALDEWVPQVPLAGADAWFLAWVRGWWNETDPADKELIRGGYEHLARMPGWETDPETNATHLRANPEKYVGLATSFFPLIERQFWAAGEGAPARKSAGIMRYFEQYGELADLDGDGVRESYQYVHPANPQGRFAIDGSLFAAMTIPDDGSARDAVRDLFRATPPFHELHKDEPRIAHADWPNVMVPAARYDAAARVLRFQLVQGDRPLAAGRTTVVELANAAGLADVTLGGAAYSAYAPGRSRGTVLLTAPAPTNTPQVWEARF